MAKLLFSKKPDLDLTTFIQAIKVDSDAQYVCALHSCKIVEITDAEYENLFDGTKELSVENDTVSLVDLEFDNTIKVDEAAFTEHYTQYKGTLEDRIAKAPNHSKITEAQECLTFLNTIDPGSRSYPSDHLDKVLKDNNKYIGFSAF
tara:strand:- start:242 stop:682 length:441 start_codon:yes stop_codon:yes gene_type:complete